MPQSNVPSSRSDTLIGFLGHKIAWYKQVNIWLKLFLTAFLSKLKGLSVLNQDKSIMFEFLFYIFSQIKFEGILRVVIVYL